MANETWAERITREAKRGVERRYGAGLGLLSSDVVEALVCREVLAVMAARDQAEDDGVSAVSCWQAICRAMAK